MPTNRKPKPTMKTKPLTLEQIEEGERLCREATQAPWETFCVRGSRKDEQSMYAGVREKHGPRLFGYEMRPGHDDSPVFDDLEVAAFARNHLADLLASARRELAMQQQLAELESSFRTTASVLSDRSVAGAWLEAADRIDQLRKGEG